MAITETVISKNILTNQVTEISTVKVSEKGQIAIPVDIREIIGIKAGDILLLIQDEDKILLQKTDKEIKKIKNEFLPLMKQSEKVAKKFWGNKVDEHWDKI